MTEQDPRLRDALRPTRQDQHDAERIVDAVLAGQAPAPGKTAADPKHPDGVGGWCR